GKMGVKDNIITPYFEDPNVFCDFINGAVFGGKQVLRPEYLESLPRELVMQRNSSNKLNCYASSH
ncbi:MAG: hypothetical protein Q3Y17_22470, partial [Blautia sp.]|nr:hypothetical protein [Blautia sp.]